MRIGILTFHWGTNYGGVLQAYALQTYLKGLNYDVEIINYAPKTFRDKFLLCFKSKSVHTIKKNVCEYLKEQKFKRFRKKNLNLSNTRYYNATDCELLVSGYDIIIVGSDQVWNPYIALNYGWMYWLPVKSNIRKIAYAVSLGCEQYPTDVLAKVSGLINDFYAISVRENTAIKIIQPKFSKGHVYVVPDPTLLVDSAQYMPFVKRHINNRGCFIYVLQENQKLIAEIEKILQYEYDIYKPDSNKWNQYSIEEWLSGIYNSKLVITNSFHGVMFSLIFHRDFFVTLIEGSLSGMNDRIYTILEYLGIQNRIIKNAASFTMMKKQTINWEDVDTKLSQFKEIGTKFLSDNFL